jgi:hypothetical protein
MLSNKINAVFLTLCALCAVNTSFAVRLNRMGMKVAPVVAKTQKGSKANVKATGSSVAPAEASQEQDAWKIKKRRPAVTTVLKSGSKLVIGAGLGGLSLAIVYACLTKDRAGWSTIFTDNRLNEWVSSFDFFNKIPITIVTLNLVGRGNAPLDPAFFKYCVRPGAAVLSVLLARSSFYTLKNSVRSLVQEFSGIEEVILEEEEAAQA